MDDAVSLVVGAPSVDAHTGEAQTSLTTQAADVGRDLGTRVGAPPQDGLIGSLKRSIGLTPIAMTAGEALAELRADVDWLLTFAYALIGLTLLLILFRR
jgi:hypothetical protein